MTRCTALSPLLRRLRQADRAVLAEMAAHIRACARCRRGRIALPEEFEAPRDLALDHEARRPGLAAYYESTHPEYPMALLSDREIAAVALHLALCTMCRDEFEVLCEISAVEEQGKMFEQEE